MPNRRASWAWEAAAVVVLALSTAVALRGWHPLDTVFEHRDTAFMALVLDHLQKAALGAGSWREVPLAWPVHDGIANGDWILGEALVTLPFGAIDPLVRSNVAAVIGLFATAWAVHRVATALLGPGPHTWVAGVAGGLNPWALAHVQHVNLVQHHLGVLGALLLGSGLAKDDPRRTAAGAALVGLGFHFGAYVGVYGALLGAVTAAAAAISRTGTRGAWLGALGGAVAAGLTVAPVAAVYLRTARFYGAWHDASELELESWSPVTSVLPLHGVAAHGWLGPAYAPDPANPGYVVLVLAAIGLWTARRAGPRWAWGAVVAVVALSAWLALGPSVPGPWSLLAGGTGLRAPVRWIGVAMLGMGVLAASAAKALGDALGPRGVVVGALLLAPLLAEKPSIPGGMPLAPPDPVYAALDALPPGPVLDEGILAVRMTCGHDNPAALRAAVHHQRPTLGGQYAPRFEALRKVNDIAIRWPAPEAAVLVRATGVVAIVDHPPLAEPPAGATCEEVDGHLVCRVDQPGGPVPSPEAFVPADGGPVVGVRYEGVSAQQVSVRCDGRAFSVPFAPWEALSAVRFGASSDVVEVVFGTPCEGAAQIDPPGTPLTRR